MMNDPFQTSTAIETLLAGMSEAVIVTDTQRQIIRVNAAAETLFGYGEPELIGLKTQLLYSHVDEFEARGLSHFNPDAEASYEGSYRVSCRKKSGQTFIADTRGGPVRGPDNEVIGYVGIISDVSREISTQACLSDLYAITTDQSLDRTERIQRLINRGCEYFGVEIGIVSEIVGETYTVKYVQTPDGSLSPGVGFDLSGTYCSQVLKADGPVSYHKAGESELRTHPCYQAFALETYIGAPLIVNDRRYGTVNFSSPEPRSTPFTEDDLKMIQLFSQWIGQEVSYILHLQALDDARLKANALQDKAEAANLAKSSFLANMSHEIRTPLSAVLGMNDLLGRTELTEKQAQYVTAISASGGALLNLVSHVLDLSRIEAGELTLEMDTLDMFTLARTSLEAVRGAAQAKQLHLRLDADANADASYRGDAARISQILINLLGNAIKFTPRGEICLRLICEPDLLRLEVDDTGPGVKDDDKGVIFDRFSQTDTNITRQHDGAGLGLSIVNELVKLHEGRCGVEDSASGGALFWVEFPRDQNKSSQTPALTPSLHETPPINSINDSDAIRVLVVDDDYFCRFLMAEMVSSLGCRVQTAEHGEDAINTLREDPDVDAVIIDLHMPRLSGIQTIEVLRREGTLKSDVPIFFITADVTTEARQSIGAIPGARYMMKPVDTDTLYEELNQVARACA